MSTARDIQHCTHCFWMGCQRNRQNLFGHNACVISPHVRLIVQKTKSGDHRWAYLHWIHNVLARHITVPILSSARDRMLAADSCGVPGSFANGPLRSGWRCASFDASSQHEGTTHQCIRIQVHLEHPLRPLIVASAPWHLYMIMIGTPRIIKSSLLSQRGAPSQETNTMERTISKNACAN